MSTIIIKRGASKVLRVYHKTRLLSVRIQGQVKGELLEMGMIEIKSSSDEADDRVALSLYLRPEISVDVFDIAQGLVFTKHGKD